MPRKPRILQAAATSEAASGPVKAAPCVLRLYVARPTPSSRRAEANLAAALAKMAAGAKLFEVEFVDVVQNPHQAVKDRIIVTPCLIVVGTTPAKTLVGDLQDTEILRRFLEWAVAVTA